MPLLEIENLSVEFPTSQGTLRAVDRIDLTLDEGEVLGGEPATAAADQYAFCVALNEALAPAKAVRL